MRKERQHVERVKQEINKQMNKYADKVIVSMYTPEKEVERTDGEIWTDSENRQWTMKNGMKQRLSPLQGAKTPWWCPQCNRTMQKLDINVWRAKGVCYDCLAKEESKIKMSGEWGEYVEKKNMENLMAYLRDRIVELTYYHDTLSNPEVMHFDDQTGNLLMVDRFTIPLDKVKADIKEDVVAMNKRLTELEETYAEKFEDVVGESEDK